MVRSRHDIVVFVSVSFTQCRVVILYLWHKTLQQFDDCTTLCDVLGGVLGGHSEDSCPPKCSEWIDVPLFNHNTLSLIRNLQVFTGQLHMCLIMGFVDQGNFAGSAGFQTVTA